MTHPRAKSSADVVPPLIQVVGIGKTYMQSAGAVSALGEICLEMQRGDLIAVVGPSGSGKSTLMNLLGLLDVPTAGHYALAGRDVSQLSADEQASIRNKSIGFIYQAFNLLARSKAVENVELPLIYGGVRKKDRQRRALQALEEVGLSHRRDHWPHELSGGEQQRVAIARALVSNPELILADEPTGALDSKTSAEILHILQGLNQRGITVIIVTHNPSVAARARRIVELADGRIVRDEKVEPTRGYPPQPAEWLNEEARGPVRMAFAEGVRAAFRALRANILRTGLTMLGIIIGVAAVITMVAIGSGAQQRVEEEIRSLGANLLLIQPGSQRSGGMRLAAGTRQTLTEADAASIAREIEDIEAVAPGVSAAVQIVHGNRNWSTNLAGITPEYLQAREWPIAAGRSFSAHEVASGAKVVLLGATVAQELFGNTHPIGRIVRVDNIPMNVIGRM
jgi:macrolide transport system ATP-binding/permease protein